MHGLSNRVCINTTWDLPRIGRGWEVVVARKKLKRTERDGVYPTTTLVLQAVETRKLCGLLFFAAFA